MPGIPYVTREEVKAAADIKETARNNTQVDNAILAGSEAVEKLMHRKFYPEIATRYFDWPNQQHARPWRLWLDANEVISVSSLTTGGVSIAPTDYFLEPANDGPPYTRIEINLDTVASFVGSSTHQRNIEVTGVFGYRADESPAGQLGSSTNASATTFPVTDSSAIGVGHLIKAGDERMLVTEKRMVDTGQNLGSGLTALANDITVSVTTGSEFHVGEVIQVDSEKLLIVDIAGNNLAVKRAWDGSVLAQHNSGTDIYAPRTLVVERGVLGTTAASHSNGDQLAKHRVPSLIRLLALAEALNTLNQQSSGYAGRSASVEAQGRMQVFGVGLDALRLQAFEAYGRKARMRSV